LDFEQEMTRWQWHQLDHMQIICTSLQDEQQLAQDERRQDAVDLARHKTTTRKANNDRAGPAVCQVQTLNNGV